ncbi:MULTISPECIES: hypothetical protein [Luteimonas]|uniref:DUF1269 domain-containing protein n=1 Tax=Luteimonas chenhongjianii TaxID=2006110 RepID=A0A290XEN5_9GAMM|nr:MULTISPECIES: hypothetical protein [Luteimonas]ATD67590.1 hypothetical protein CNR27_09205 [Luteimonas chenhongjianii]RPD88749.1 hypothetical protein EGK76_06425 [Luteimonas sp. 100069]
MKIRRVYSTSSLPAAEAAVRAVRSAGIPDEDVSLVARGDIELQAMPEHQKEAPTDFKHAAIRGAGIGGATGLLAGLVAVAIPPLGLTLAGVALTTLGGAAIGTWASSMVGASLPDPVRRKFEEEIESGRILVVIDGEKESLAPAEAALREAGAVHLPYEDASALS